nr:hypothetical protein CFP56_00208 [Quercus suber]
MYKQIGERREQCLKHGGEVRVELVVATYLSLARGRWPDACSRTRMTLSLDHRLPSPSCQTYPVLGSCSSRSP